jgi:hypothetical protein
VIIKNGSLDERHLSRAPRARIENRVKSGAGSPFTFTATAELVALLWHSCSSQRNHVRNNESRSIPLGITPQQTVEARAPTFDSNGC